MRCAAMATQSFLRILELLEQHGVEYVVVGGVAAAPRRPRHDVLRPTWDDLLVGGHLLLMTNSDPLDVLGFIGQGKRYEDV